MLSTEEYMSDLRLSVGQLPTNRNVLVSLRYADPLQAVEEGNYAIPVPLVHIFPHPFDILNNSIVAVVWIINRTKVWFLGCISDYHKDDPSVAMIDHLERTVPGQNEYWRYPRNPDTCEPEMSQIMGIEPIYEWEVHTRFQKLKLQNHVRIADYMTRMILE